MLHNPTHSCDYTPMTTPTRHAGSRSGIARQHLRSGSREDFLFLLTREWLPGVILVRRKYQRFLEIADIRLASGTVKKVAEINSCLLGTMAGGVSKSFLLGILHFQGQI